jgi:cyclopropane-fatty-acyl-phospholipid synthase
VLDIGCGWGANLEYLSSRGVKRAHGITLSTAQFEEIMARKLPGVEVWILRTTGTTSRRRSTTPSISIEMIDHLCSPAQANQGMAIEIYREYFKKCASG